jgi:S-adenosylmethionine decarboxylase
LQQKFHGYLLEKNTRQLGQKLAPNKSAEKTYVADQNTNQAESFDTFGRHILADLSNCQKELISSVDFVKKTLEEAVVKAGATIISSRFHQFTPIGVSGIILLSESHCSIHTWPEEQYAAIDIYTCGEHVFPQIACDYIAEKLGALEVCITSVERGLKSARKLKESFVHRINTTENLLTFPKYCN